MVYYGLSLNSGNLAGDFYLNFFLTGLVEFPAYTLCLVLLDRTGRKKLLCACMVLGGLACICTIFTVLYVEKREALNTCQPLFFFLSNWNKRISCVCYMSICFITCTSSALLNFFIKCILI